MSAAAEAGRRVEEILDRLAASGEREARDSAEELVRVLMDFYGAALARMVELLGTGPAVSALLGDELTAGLLVLHDLHPEDTARRISRAMASVRGHSVEQAGYDDATGTLWVRLVSAGGCGCPSTGEGARQAVQDAMACFAPEVTQVKLEDSGKEPALLQISTRPVVAAGSVHAS